MTRTFAGLRPSGPVAQPPGRTIEDDYRDLFNTDMGQRVLADMMEESHAHSPEGADDRALREREGARKFVARLRARVTTSGRRTGRPDPS